MTAGLLDTLKAAIAAIEELGLDPSTAGGAVALRFLLEGEGAGAGAVATPPGPAATGGIPRRDHTDGVRGDDEQRPPEMLVAEWVGVDPERLLDVLEFTPDGVALRIPSARLKRSKADRQRLLALLKLAIDRKAYGADDVSAQHVNAVCSDYNCMDQNVAGNLAAREDLIMRRGKRGSYTYRPTQPGLERARALLRELLDGSSELVV